jgi:hypothetical protein
MNIQTRLTQFYVVILSKHYHHNQVVNSSYPLPPNPLIPDPATIIISSRVLLGYFIVGLFCYICSFLLFVWLFFFTYALLAGLSFTCRG